MYEQLYMYNYTCIIVHVQLYMYDVHVHVQLYMYDVHVHVQLYTMYLLTELSCWCTYQTNWAITFFNLRLNKERRGRREREREGGRERGRKGGREGEREGGREREREREE